MQSLHSPPIDSSPQIFNPSTRFSVIIWHIASAPAWTRCLCQVAKLVSFCFDCTINAVGCILSMLTTYSKPDCIADIISVPFFVLITALLFLKFTSAPLVLGLATEIKLDLNPGVYNMLSKVIILLCPLIFVWSLILPFPTTLNISPSLVVSLGNSCSNGVYDVKSDRLSRTGQSRSGITLKWIGIDNKMGTTLVSARALCLDLLSCVRLHISGG